MGYKIKIQRVERGKTKSFYVNFPAALAEAANIVKGEEWEWAIEDRNTFVLSRKKHLTRCGKTRKRLKFTRMPERAPQFASRRQADAYRSVRHTGYRVGQCFLKQLYPMVHEIDVLFQNTTSGVVPFTLGKTTDEHR